MRVAGIFVGGRASRMGGIAKGLLVAPDGEPIVIRTRRLLESAGAACVLVGAGGAAYAALGLPALADDPTTRGPLAGLLALLAHAGSGPALAVACDMPLLTAELVQRLVDAPPAAVVAPRRTDPARGRLWEPLFARYDPAAVLPVARALVLRGERKLQLLVERSGAAELPLTAAEEALLVDWDAPGDLPPPTLPADGPHGTRGR